MGDIKSYVLDYSDYQIGNEWYKSEDVHKLIAENKSLRNCQNCHYDCDMLIRDSCEKWENRK